MTLTAEEIRQDMVDALLQCSKEELVDRVITMSQELNSISAEMQPFVNTAAEYIAIRETPELQPHADDAYQKFKVQYYPKGNVHA